MQHIYDSKLQRIVPFNPRIAGEVGMYVCGPTVQSAPHIGHLRSALAYDIIRRWFTATGHRVTFVRNVTDIDDKILEGAKKQQAEGNPETWWALAYRVEREFTAAYDAVGIEPPTYEPRATANITEMIDLIERLIERGHAYQAVDGSASVYFDTRSWPDYGALTHQSVEQMEDAADSEPVGKRDPRDFALWKAHRDHEPDSASWASPWGRGRPGWHIECSAMAARYLGSAFDIHGGGLDLRFPHHENELAQSNAAGDPFATHWVHNGLVNTSGQKMSKSLGNSMFAHDLISATRPIVLRYFLTSAHYRSTLDYSEKSLAEADAAFSRIEAFIARVQSDAPLEPLGEVTTEDLPQAFVRAMHDDFGVPEALAVMHERVRAGNAALDSGETDAARDIAYEVRAMLEVFGLNPERAPWAQNASATTASAERALTTLVEGLLAERETARAEKQFERSDELRDQLAAAGIVIEDSAAGTRWSVK